MRSFVGWSLIRPLHPPALLYENVQSTMRGQSLLWQRWAHVFCKMAALQSYESAQKHPCGHVSAGVASGLVAVSKITQAHVALASDLSKPTYAILSEPFTSAMVWCGRRKCQDILDEPAKPGVVTPKYARSKHHCKYTTDDNWPTDRSATLTGEKATNSFF